MKQKHISDSDLKIRGGGRSAKGADRPLETKPQAFANIVGMSLAFLSLIWGSISPVVREIRADVGIISNYLNYITSIEIAKW